MRHPMRYPCRPGCRCSFIPPVVAEHLARKGVDDARVSYQQSRMMREKRKATAAAISMATFTGAAPVGKGDRLVYDCEQTWQQRLKLVRGESDPETADADVTIIHKYAGIVRDYFQTVMGRNSIDNLGMDLILNVHFGVRYLNAFWDGDEMTFGDGDGKIFTSFANSLDVVAHELTHGVIQFTANLEYKGQSGAALLHK